MLKLFHILGSKIIRFIEEAGRIVLLLFQTIRWAVRPPYAVRDILRQMEQVGVNSMPVVLITATFTGMVPGASELYRFQEVQCGIACRDSCGPFYDEGIRPCSYRPDGFGQGRSVDGGGAWDNEGY